MVNRPKQQGTAFESWLVDHFKELGFFSQRLAEGGANDLGDLEIVLPNSMAFTIESKATQTLNVTRVLGKARAKSGHPTFTFLIWKRLVKLKEGQKKRRPDGEKIVVAIGLDTLDLLLTMAGKR